MKRLYLLLILLVSVSARSLADETILLGDMNDDNKISIADVTLLVNTLTGKAPKQTIYVFCGDHVRSLIMGDMNNDDEITTDDVMCLVNVLLSKAPKLTMYAAYVDLGLPSGTLWCTCNLGAISPSRSGNYYTWVTDIADNDPAASLGAGWSTPTGEQLIELVNNTTHRDATVFGVDGVRFVSKKNGNSIFLPQIVETNSKNDDEDEDVYEEETVSGAYWGKDLTEDDEDMSDVWALKLDDSAVSVDAIPQNASALIRPVFVNVIPTQK